jgi:hypothetical protein
MRSSLPNGRARRASANECRVESCEWYGVVRGAHRRSVKPVRRGSSSESTHHLREMALSDPRICPRPAETCCIQSLRLKTTRLSANLSTSLNNKSTSTQPYGRDTMRLASHVPSAKAKPATNAATARARYDIPVHGIATPVRGLVDRIRDRAFVVPAAVAFADWDEREDRNLPALCLGQASRTMLCRVQHVPLMRVPKPRKLIGQ